MTTSNAPSILVATALLARRLQLFVLLPPLQMTHKN